MHGAHHACLALPWDLWCRQFELAQQLHLTPYVNLVGRFMGWHAHEIDTEVCTTRDCHAGRCPAQEAEGLTCLALDSHLTCENVDICAFILGSCPALGSLCLCPSWLSLFCTWTGATHHEVQVRRPCWAVRGETSAVGWSCPTRKDIC